MKRNDWRAGALLLVLGIAFWLLCWRKMTAISLLMSELLLLLGGVAAVTDVREKRVPNGLVGAMLAAWVLVMVPQLFLRTEQTVPLLFNGLAGALLGGGLFLIVYVVSRRGLGGGDVKLMAAAGLYLGVDGVLPAMLYGSILTVLTAGVLLLLKRIGRKDAIPLVPFLYIGMVLTMLIG